MKLKAKDGVGGVSVGGKEYTADERGLVDVPDEFGDAVMKAGFSPVQDEQPAPPVVEHAPDGDVSTHE